jgi:hypothetical protein
MDDIRKRTMPIYTSCWIVWWWCTILGTHCVSIQGSSTTTWFSSLTPPTTRTVPQRNRVVPHDRYTQTTHTDGVHDQVPYYYHVTTSDDDDDHGLGRPNPEAAAGNPLKGLASYPEFSNYDIHATSIDASLEAYYLGLDELMKGDPNQVGYDQAFDWTALERRLQDAASRNRHVILTIMCHYPNWNRLSVPQYLLDAGILLLDYADFLGGGKSPYYGDPLLLNALQQFIQAFGEKYDGDTRIGFINLGLLGFWGEWHTYPDDFVPESAKLSLVKWYSDAFKTTKLQAGATTTDTSYYFWPSVTAAGQNDFWRVAPMGGETRPEQQPIVFESSYPAGTYTKQDFVRCMYTTHATYMYVY